MIFLKWIKNLKPQNEGGILILLLQTLALTFITILCVLPFSCKVTEEGIIFVGGDYVSPVLEDVCVIDERTVNISFSEKIKLRSFTVSEQIKEISDSSEHSDTIELSPALKAAAGGYGKVDSDFLISEDGCTISFSATDRYEVGKAYEIFGTVEDRAGNTLTYCVPFCGFNSRIPRLVMTEIQPKYKKVNDNSFRCEYVELLALTAGNLSGVELFSGADGEAKKFLLPPAEVEAGDLILIHLRSAGSGCTTETDNLNASTATYSGKNIRDIWSDNTKSRIGDSSDVIIIRDSVKGTILDALMYAPQDALEWGKGLSAPANLVYESGIYESNEVSDAEISNGFTASVIYSFVRLDAAELRAKALSGQAAEESFEYPVKRSAESWAVRNCTPGTL